MKKKFRFLRDVAHKQYFNLILLVVSTMIFVFLNLVQPMVFGFMVDNIVNQKPIESAWLNTLAKSLGGVDYIRENLWIGALVIIGLGLCSALFTFLRSRLNGVISEDVAFNIKNKLFGHLMHVPYRFYVTSKTGDLIQRGTSDIDTIRRVFANQISEFLYAIFMVFIAFVIMLNRNVKLAFIASILLPVIFLFAVIFFRRVQKIFLEYEEVESNLTNSITENLAATRVIKAFNREAYETELFSQKNADLSNVGKRMIDALSIYWGVSDFICFLSIVIVLVNGVIMVVNGSLTIGDAFVFTSYTGMMVWPLRQMGRIIADMSKVGVALDRLIEVCDEPLEDLDEGVRPNITGNLVLDNVKFNYHDDIAPVLKGVSLSIEAGESVAILGPTGSGKSSLIHILMGLYDYTDGSITLDGVELKDISKKHLRKNVSVVLQEPFLFSRTIKENILMSRPDASLKDIQYAANIAHVEDFINNFDLGYETMIGERGTTLSGGQKQRVAIARTVVNDYPIIIFDDSLSAVDTETDANIRRKLQNVKNKTTTIIITQRISSSKDADKIFVLEHGVITQCGTHESLLQEEGLYKRVNAVQSQQEGGDTDGES